jgi:hypothetical protein
MEKIRQDSFSKMMAAQKNLVAQYITIEGLPHYPVDLQSKSGQKLIRDFSARYREEMDEAYEQLELALFSASINHLEDAKQHILAYQEEIADTKHFILELLIYAGLDVEDIEFLLLQYAEQHGLENLIEKEDAICSLFNMGEFLNQKNKPWFIHPSGQFQIFSKVEVREGIYLGGGHLISEETLEKHALFMHQITYKLSKAIRMLKNKDWVQTEKPVNFNYFATHLSETLIILFQYLAYAGFTRKGIVSLYHDKNSTNQERIKNKY